MGSVAASGGYWISTASDEIWAGPETITGSIGIFGVFPTVDKPLAKYLGVHTDGVGTTRFSDALRPDRAAGPGGGRRLPAGDQPRVRGVPRPRGAGPEDDARAGGQDRPRARLERRGREGPRPRGPARRPRPGDRVGGEARQAREGLPRVVRREGEELPREADVDAGGPGPRRGVAAGWVSEPSPSASALSVAGRLRDLRADVERLARWNDPRGIYAHCLCGEE